jgi:hypothetical protein
MNPLHSPVRRLLLRVAAVVALLGCLTSPAASEVIFDFTFFDVESSTGVGFDDPVLGAARRAAVETTAAQMGSLIGQNATVEVGVAPSQTDGTGFIGLASAEFLDTTAGIRDGEIYRRIVLGEPDTEPAILDAGMVFDFGYSVALSGTPGVGEAYFPDVVRHELTHALGYGSFLSATGTGFGGTAPDAYTRFDSFLTTDGGPNPGLPVVDAAGNLLLDAGTYAAAYGSGLVFDGPATRAANGGTPLKLYLSDPTHSNLASDVMFPSPAVGFARDQWSDLDVAVLTDLGYTIVPEPSTMSLLLASLAAVSTHRRNRRRVGGTFFGCDVPRAWNVVRANDGPGCTR